MQKKKTYAELLKDPRWQKKRLEIMQRDNFMCRHCGVTDKELQVHHLSYMNGVKPWDYSDAELVTLCKDCHTLSHRVDTPIIIGKVYEYIHGDFTNYMICYDVDYSGETTLIYLLGVDSGSGYDTMFVFHVIEDEFSRRCALIGDFFDDEYEDSYFQKSLMYVFFNYVNDTENVDEYFVGMGDDLQASIETKDMVRRNLHKILANNDSLRNLYAEALKNKYSVIHK